jgi:apolipoprotein N-acyltransferase
VLRAAAGLGAAISCGVGLVLAFPPYEIEILAWFAFVPLLLVLRSERATGWQAFLAGTISGLIYFGGVNIWTLNILLNFVRAATIYNVLVFSVLAGFLAVLYFGGFAWLGRRVLDRWGAIGWALIPCLWVASEVVRTHFPIGFPWGLLGSSQYRVLPVLQSAAVWGVYGLSFLILAGNASLAALLTVDRRSLPAQVFAGATAALLVVCWVAGAFVLRNNPPASGGLTVAVVQPSVEQDRRWNPELTRGILGGYLRMSERAVARGAELVIWPETATPLVLTDSRVFPEIQGFAERFGVEIVAGSLRREAPGDGATRIYNSTYLIRSDGSIGGVYDKVVLTPFGEYVPYRRWMPFLPRVGPVLGGDMAAAPEPYLLATRIGAAGVFTCFEATFPHLANWATRRGAEYLINPSNEAWHKQGLGRDQLLAQALVRSVENRRYQVRSVNTGISAIIDPYGRILARAGENEEAVLVGQLRPRRDRSVYSAGGRFFPIGCAIVSAFAIVGRRRHGPRPVTKTKLRWTRDRRTMAKDNARRRTDRTSFFR